MDPKMLKEAMDAVIANMGSVAKAGKARKYAKKAPAKAEVSVSEVEGGPTLAGLMNKPGSRPEDLIANSGGNPLEEPVQVSEVEGGANLLGLLSKKGQTPEDIAAGSDLSDEELAEIMNGAR